MYIHIHLCFGKRDAKVLMLVIEQHAVDQFRNLPLIPKRWQHLSEVYQSSGTRVSGGA